MLKSSLLPDAVDTDYSPPESVGECLGRLKALCEREAPPSTMTPVIERAMVRAAIDEQRLAQQDARIRDLESLSITDEVTGLFNRRGFDTKLAETLARAKRDGEQGLVVLCDLNRFKVINDTYGHPAGDAVLRALAAELRGMVRRSDVVARLGGDEFGALLLAARPSAVAARIEPLRSRLSRLAVTYDGLDIRFSASIGYSAYGPNSNYETVMMLADKALYRVKHGR
jgi:diguanylate cyclase (GGDEF)-like protein